MGDLPMIKCSSCGANVDIFAMGDHICGNSALGTSKSASPTPSPPPPPPKSGFRRPTLGTGDARPSKTGRAEPPSHIDPFRANRPFLQPDNGTAGNESLFPSPLSTSTGTRSPLYALQRSQTTPIPAETQAPNTVGSGEYIPSFPLPRSMSERRVNGMALKEAISAPPAPSPGYADAMRKDLDPPLLSAHLPLDSQDDIPPPPLPKDYDPRYTAHHPSTSIDSKSSYRTSLASSRYDNRYSKRSTAMSSRRPSFSGYRYEDDIPAIPPSPRHYLHSVFSDSSTSDISLRREGKSEVHSGFDFGSAHASVKGDLDKPSATLLRVSSNANSEHLSSGRGSAESFFNSPSQSTHEASIDLPDPAEVRAVSPAGSGKSDYKPFKPPGFSYLQPHPSDQDERDEIPRKYSDATSESAISVTNFARALGLDIDDAVEDSTTTSDSSPSETRSGTSLSSIQSDRSVSRRKPSDQSRLGPVAEDHQSETQPRSDRILGEALPTTSPTSLERPRIPETLLSPESPTDPALLKGNLSLIPERSPADSEDTLEPRPITRSATEPTPRPQQGRARGPCRGCGETIVGKAISSADGRLTGRYHRACFVCFQCRTPFETTDFYVLNDLPFCAQHYHQRNGSLCAGCLNGIEGQYLETNERTGPGPGDRQKFHLDCLRCRTCQVDLKGEYFEWDGLVYCERDARRAAASSVPHHLRRPTMPSSPLAPPYGPPFPSRGRPPPPGYPGRGRGRRPPPGSFDGYRPPPPARGRGPYRGGPPPSPGSHLEPPPGPRRFPERRTTRLMMI
ncbi:LIM domain-containing protein [Aspergillus lucknowensis]|uniref:LIM zinc-binding domain-containing protein n=1 Tax=Aspergillus lucknowensis TaxID=176173 RepID=A0ABR4LUN5_9EURO